MYIKEKLLSLKIKSNVHYIDRYVKFISSRNNIRIKYETSRHHILPKARDFFPEYANMKEFSWNICHLTHREHFIAHMILYKAFPGSSQVAAFFNMSNIIGKQSSKIYHNSLREHSIKQRNAIVPEERRKRISEKLTGRIISEETKNKLKGHIVSEESRNKISKNKKGKKMSAEALANMLDARKTWKRNPHSEIAKENISRAKKAQNRRWFNNGIISQQFSSSPDDSWIPGMINHHAVGRFWINNGFEEKMVTVYPGEPWVNGRLFRKRNRKKMKEI